MFLAIHMYATHYVSCSCSKLGVIKEAVDNTVSAAQLNLEYSKVSDDHVHGQGMFLPKKLQDAGAVGSSKAAKIYGLNILAEDIQDDADNVTRFLMLAREPIIPSTDGPFKITGGFEEIGMGRSCSHKRLERNRDGERKIKGEKREMSCRSQDRERKIRGEEFRLSSEVKVGIL
ncbi:hypothetical protein NE237_010263 [Protea cynaroides]|uniref:Prephenate dehydratase domain-containing protein n=1 Tax=Protea cynaroides TaxID=273540 RepID=A0A9Q0R129_9MAGN|nr:hypothetical protein NE237_010263 [Protea cynaroides]